tara:strand:- start:834 stop:1406 length:573 start_codon:yes stop_codon:yes gene_type:complete
MKRARNPTRIAFAGIVCSLVISAIVGIFVILVGNFDETEIKILFTSGSLAGLSILSMPSLYHLERKQYRIVARVGVMTAIAGFLAIQLVIWSEGDFGGEFFWKAVATDGILAFSMNHMLFLLMMRLEQPLSVMSRWVTILAISTVAIFMMYVIWANEVPEQAIRIFASVVVLDALGTIALPIMVRLSKIK